MLSLVCFPAGLACITQAAAASCTAQGYSFVAGKTLSGFHIITGSYT